MYVAPPVDKVSTKHLSPVCPMMKCNAHTVTRGLARLSVLDLGVLMNNLGHIQKINKMFIISMKIKPNINGLKYAKLVLGNQ